MPALHQRSATRARTLDKIRTVGQRRAPRRRGKRSRFPSAVRASMRRHHGHAGDDGNDANRSEHRLTDCDPDPDEECAEQKQRPQTADRSQITQSTFAAGADFHHFLARTQRGRCDDVPCPIDVILVHHHAQSVGRISEIRLDSGDVECRTRGSCFSDRLESSSNAPVEILHSLRSFRMSVRAASRRFPHIHIVGHS
jgi:hypothetical protein